MRYLVSTNPYTLKEISRTKELDDEEIIRLLKLSEQVFQDYKKTSFESRKKLMLLVADILASNAEEYAKIITNEMGKLFSESVNEVKKCAWVCEYYANHAQDFLSNDSRESDAKESFVMYQPIGPVLAIMPWNFPFWQVFRFAAPTIMAGNTAILKHASNVQACAKAIEMIFLKAGFEEGVFQNVSISSSKVDGLISRPEIKAVTLTGSEQAGSAVASAAGKNLKKCVLELGGNNAFVVLSDADLDLAIEMALKARLQNSGQSCIAAKRFILERKIHDPFVKMLTEKVSKLKMGDPFDPGTEIAPLVSKEQSEEVALQVNDSLKLGAELKFQSKAKNAFYSPVILCNVSPDMPVFKNETFGPVFAITRAEDVTHALELSNNSDFGLGMQVFTTSPEKAKLFISSANEGAVFINGMVKSDPRLPFGGLKKSGFGRELAREGILEFVNVKTISIS